MSHHGDVEVVISTPSANALAIVPELETWTVQPTLQRGAKRKAPGSGQSFKQKVARARKRAARGPKAQAKKDAKKKQAAVNADMGIGENFTYGRGDFKRTGEGKPNTSKILRQIYELDCQTWPKSRAFDAKTGLCRLNNVPAITLDQVIEHAPGCCSAKLLS